MITSQPKSNLELLLFIDERANARDLVQDVQRFLQSHRECESDLQIINVSMQPHLAEHFKIVMTPALIKLSPPPRQAIAGKNLTFQLKASLPRWLEHIKKQPYQPPSNLHSNLAYSSELIQLADQVFKLNQEKADLKEQLRFKDRIIAVLAHDLRNPLTAVSLALETIEKSRERLSPEMIVQLLKHARNQTKIADSMIRDILEAAKGTVAEFQIEPRKMQLAKICEQVTNDFYLSSRLKEKQQSLLKDIPNDLPLVYADEERIRQVLINLLENAIKYTPVEGKIEIAILHRTAQKVEITITDNGSGIPEHLRDRIFEERFRLERDDSKEGYGIGLALCQRIIRAHYGQIWVDMVGKQGSCFHVTLPVY